MQNSVKGKVFPNYNIINRTTLKKTRFVSNGKKLTGMILFHSQDYPHKLLHRGKDLEYTI